MNDTNDEKAAAQPRPSQMADEIEKIILRSMNEGVLTLECTGDIYTVNPAALQILGYREEELKGNKFAEVFLQDSVNDQFTDLFVNAVYHGMATTHDEVPFKRPDGQTIDLSLATSFLEIDECRPGFESVVAVFRDITAFKNLERIRRRAVDHLAHELKTPLSIIAAAVEMLKNNRKSESSRQKNFARIERNINRLHSIQQLVEEILNPRAFRPTQFDVAATVVRILKEIEIEAAHRSVKLIPQLEKIATAFLDPDFLRIVLRTLVKNAIENTPDGGEVFISIENTDSGTLLEIKDEGIGIPISDQEFLFEGFHHTVETDEYSSKKPYDFEAGGKGLELLRLKNLSQAGNFEISFESRRCRYIPTNRDHCPGSIADCLHVENASGCMESGGTIFRVLFRGRDR